MKLLDALTACRVRAHFRALERLHVPPYKGSTFRGAFGHAFRKVSCPIICHEPRSCLLRYRCAYSVCFETPIPPDAAIMRKYPFAPHPFVLTPPLDSGTEYEEGSDFYVDLTLVGRGRHFLPHFIYTMEMLGTQGIGTRRGQAELLRIEDGAEERATLYERGDTDLRAEPAVITHASVHSRCAELPSAPIDLVFETPTRVKSADRFLRAPDFAAMFPSLMRRCHSLAHFHCEGREEPDVHSLLGEARSLREEVTDVHWVPWERYSSRQDQKMAMDGFVGTLRVFDVPQSLLPYILWGEILHVGKGSAFGMGRYRVKTAAT